MYLNISTIDTTTTMSRKGSKNTAKKTIKNQMKSTSASVKQATPAQQVTPVAPVVTTSPGPKSASRRKREKRQRQRDRKQCGCNASVECHQAVTPPIPLVSHRGVPIARVACGMNRGGESPPILPLSYAAATTSSKDNSKKHSVTVQEVPFHPSSLQCENLQPSEREKLKMFSYLTWYEIQCASEEDTEKLAEWRKIHRIEC